MTQPQKIAIGQRSDVVLIRDFLSAAECTEGYQGGRTRFDLSGEPEPVSIVPATGTALVFMHDRLHQGEEIRSGVKYVLRTDVMYRREPSS